MFERPDYGRNRSQEKNVPSDPWITMMVWPTPVVQRETAGFLKKLSTSRGDVSTLKTSVMPSKHLPTTTQAPMRRLLVGAVISMMVHGKSSEYECQKYRKAKRESIPADFVKICEL
mmetsp:Transcript_105239/g.209200  ORF Transcript_105239/g.209200 Transcript_105239/m.209200 type:complete len:116 (+) Transcript_105239:76-423(+)